jgi:ferredoxin
MSDTRYAITVEGSGESFACAPDSSILKAMERQGRKGIAVSCRSGGCGICRVQVVQGRVQAELMSRAQVSLEDERDGIVLACRARPLSDVHLRALGLKVSPRRAAATAGGDAA